jgi:hypothetical protein
MSSYSAPTLDIYFTGLIGTAMFRKTGKQKYRDQQAQTAVNSMKSLMEKFNTCLNNLHRYYIMKADIADEVREAFDQAISATRCGSRKRALWGVLYERRKPLLGEALLDQSLQWLL